MQLVLEGAQDQGGNSKSESEIVKERSLQNCLRAYPLGPSHNILAAK